MAIDSVRQLVDDCYTGGGNWMQHFRKVSALITTAGMGVDCSMMPGYPRPNYYVGGELEATTFTEYKGIWHGGNVSPKEKFIHNIMAMAVSSAIVPAQLVLCDYLLYYPLIDMDSLDEQFFDNTHATLPRYTDGYGVRAFIVATNPYVGGAQFSINYINSDGESKYSMNTLSNTGTNISTIINSGIVAGTQGLFIPLALGCRGVRSVQSVTFNSPNGGIGCLVLVKPLATVYIREINAPAEWDFIKMQGIKLPKIEDGAYLNFLCLPNGNMTGQLLTGSITTIWR